MRSRNYIYLSGLAMTICLATVIVLTSRVAYGEDYGSNLKDLVTKYKSFSVVDGDQGHGDIQFDPSKSTYSFQYKSKKSGIEKSITGEFAFNGSNGIVMFPFGRRDRKINWTLSGSPGNETRLEGGIRLTVKSPRQGEAIIASRPAASSEEELLSGYKGKGRMSIEAANSKFADILNHGWGNPDITSEKVYIKGREKLVVDLVFYTGSRSHAEIDLQDINMARIDYGNTGESARGENFQRNWIFLSHCNDAYENVVHSQKLWECRSFRKCVARNSSKEESFGIEIRTRKDTDKIFAILAQFVPNLKYFSRLESEDKERKPSSSSSSSPSDCYGVQSDCLSYCGGMSDKSSGLAFDNSDKARCKSYCADAYVACQRSSMCESSKSFCMAKCAAHRDDNGGWLRDSNREGCEMNCMMKYKCEINRH